MRSSHGGSINNFQVNSGDWLLGDAFLRVRRLNFVNVSLGLT